MEDLQQLQVTSLTENYKPKGGIWDLTQIASEKEYKDSVCGVLLEPEHPAFSTECLPQASNAKLNPCELLPASGLPCHQLMSPSSS